MIPETKTLIDFFLVRPHHHPILVEEFLRQVKTSEVPLPDAT